MKEYQLLRVPLPLWEAIHQEAQAQHVKTPEFARGILGKHFGGKINKSPTHDHSKCTALKCLVPTDLGGCPKEF